MISQTDNGLEVFQRALTLRAYRQEVLASNIANANTPHYKARDLDFKTTLSGALAGRAGAGGPLELLRTDARHLSPVAAAPAGARLLYRTETQSSVDGNTVDMDIERAAFAENAMHYEASLGFVNNFLRNVQAAMQMQ